MKTRWVSKRAVLAIHTGQITSHGGVHGLRDDGSLESALARPRHLESYGAPDVFALAAVYAGGILRNHPFVDGNKRTALVVTGVFLYLNGWELTASQSDTVNVFIEAAVGSMDEAGLTDWLKAHCARK